MPAVPRWFTRINLWHFVWIAVVLSALLSLPMSRLIHGRVSWDYPFTASLIALAVASPLIALIKRMRDLEQALAHTTLHLRTILDSAADLAVTAIGADGRVLYANALAGRLLGTGSTTDSPTSAHVVLRRAGLSPEQARDVCERAGRTGCESIEFVRSRGARCSWIECTVAGMKSEAGQVLGWMLFARDVTLRRRAAEAVREANDTLEAMIHASPVAIVAIDLEDRVTLWNAAAERIFGWTAEEALGRPLPYVSEDMQEEFLGLRRRIQQGETLSGLELRRRKKDGSLIDVSLSTAALRDAEGRLRGTMGILADITERKRAEEALRKSEEQYRRIVETAREGIWSVDPEGRTTFVNQAMADMLGYGVADLAGTHLFTFMDAEGRVLATRNMERHRQGVAEEHEFKLRRRDGSDLWTLMSTSPILNDQGQYAGALALVTDLTERKRLEDQLRQAQKMEAVGRLAAGVAHDFNNMLTVISGYSAMLLSGPVADEALRRTIEQIKTAGERATVLTKQLLAFSRQQILRPAVLDLNEIIAGMVPMLQTLIGEAVELVPEADPALGRVNADRGQLEQVLMNLAANARDAMPAGGKLRLKTRNVEIGEPPGRGQIVRPGRYVVVSVQDTGRGMDEFTRARAFEPFFTTKGQGQGTGLGLATVYGIVKQSGGDVFVESEPGHGATFHVYLPRTDEPLDPVKPGPVSMDRLSGSETILHVEDEPAIRGVVRQTLERLGYRVLEARHGIEALLMAQQHRGVIHLLITDVIMPQMSGPEVAGQLTRVRPDLKVLYMSGYTDDAIAHHGVLDPGIAFLQKPCSPERLARKVREVLDDPVRGPS